MTEQAHTEESQTQRTKKRQPDLDSVYSINDDGSRNFLQVADVAGRWQIRKKTLYYLLVAVFLAAPWIRIGEHPLIHFDIPGRTPTSSAARSPIRTST